MCELCASNSKFSIAGYKVRDYYEKFRRHEDWRLKLCTDLQACLLLNLCDQKITPDVKLRNDKDLCRDLWSRSGLDFQYDSRFGSILRSKYADKAQSLLNELKKWGAFVRRGAGGRVYHWDTTVIQQHFDSEHKVRRWIECNRAQASARHRGQDTSVCALGPVRTHAGRVSWADNISGSPASPGYPPAIDNAPRRRHRHSPFNTDIRPRARVSVPSTPTTQRSFNFSSPSLFSPHTPSAPTTPAQPTSAAQMVSDWITGEEVVDDMIKKMNLSPGSNPPTPRSIHRTFGSPVADNPYWSSQTPSRMSMGASSIAPIPFNLHSPRSASAATHPSTLAADSPARSHPFAAMGFSSQQGRVAGQAPQSPALPQGVIDQAFAREGTPLAQRLINQHQRTQASQCESTAGTLPVKEQPKIHFGLLPSHFGSPTNTGSYQQPSVSDETEGDGSGDVDMGN